MIEATPPPQCDSTEKEISIIMRSDTKTPVLLVSVLAAVLGCFPDSYAAAKVNFIAAAAVADRQLSPRAAPARISIESEEDLVKKGYVRVGEIEVDEVTGTYWESAQIPDKIPSRDATTPLLRYAADHGGDIVIIKRDNSPESYNVTKRGKILEWEMRWRDEPYNLETATGTRVAYKRVPYNVPTVWEIVRGTEQAVRSTGSVWRNDPALANSVASKVQDDRWRDQQRRQSMAEADRQALALLEAAERTEVAGGWTIAFRDAVRRNDVEKVRTLLSDGADVKAKNQLGDTPLHAAAEGNAKEAAELLLSKEADVNAVNNDGMTPMHLAAGSDAVDVAVALLANGADVNAKAKSASTPLHMAAFFNSLSVAELLLANGADVNVKAGNGRTPLHLAAFRGAADVVPLLLAKGADINARDQNAFTPLALAVQENHKAIADYLRAKGAGL